MPSASGFYRCLDSSIHELSKAPFRATAYPCLLERVADNCRSGPCLLETVEDHPLRQLSRRASQALAEGNQPSRSPKED